MPVSVKKSEAYYSGTALGCYPPTKQAESSTSGTQQHAALEKRSHSEDHRGKKREKAMQNA